MSDLAWIAFWTGATGKPLVSGVNGNIYQTLQDCRDRNSGAEGYASVTIIGGKLIVTPAPPKESE